MVMGMVVPWFWRLSVKACWQGVAGVVAIRGGAGGGGRQGQGDDLIAGEGELAGGPVVALVGGAVVGRGVQEGGDTVDLGASARAGAAGVQGQGRVVAGHAGGGCLVEVVGQVPQEA